MPRKRASITLSIADREKAELERLALEFGQTWGEDKPNISRLVKAIAQSKLRLAVNHDWGSDRLNALYQALNLLKDQGKQSEALILAHLLLERSELSLPLRQEIQAFVDQPSHPWRQAVERYILQHQPFRLTYQDAAERIWRFTVRHARITPREDRQYLECWCAETEGNQDIPSLQHNWSLRLDRIADEAVISPVEGDWRPNLDQVEVEFHLLGGLALAYRTKQEGDRVNEWLGDRQIRRVVRSITNTFWFFREMRRYGAECAVIGPSEVRDRFAGEAIAMARHYAEYRVN